MPLGLALVISFFLNMVVEGLLLIIPFLLVRKFCGGFHFQSPVLCGILSAALQFPCVFIKDRHGLGNNK
ncbi:hypothetical protein ADH66_17155 [Acutalibacter muris]|uniref:Uncharacterized protein n=2 Tax=Acutalibacter muris TaxID=1796620 RepID=A0ABM6LA02_9FIRM|nr:hypothetical protein A4V00_11240 [Hungateiclostridiaceae bacterium KB18]ASB42230.1 hypothetical protein ADH66_17155 [Acutalibacter muris]